MQTKCLNKNNMINASYAVVIAAFLSFQNGGAQAEKFTAGSVLEKMETKELNAYLTGLIHGFGHARYIKDGKNANAGMKCIYDWFHDADQSVNQIITAFDKYKKHMPGTIVAAMLKQQCGE